MKKWFDKRTNEIGDSVLSSIRSARDKAMLTVASVLSKLPWGKKSTIISGIKKEVTASAKMTDALDKFVEKKQDKAIKKAENKVAGKVTKNIDLGKKEGKPKNTKWSAKDVSDTMAPPMPKENRGVKKQRESSEKRRPKGTDAWDTRRKLYGPSGRKGGGITKSNRTPFSSPRSKAMLDKFKADIDSIYSQHAKDTASKMRTLTNLKTKLKKIKAATRRIDRRNDRGN